LQFAWLSSQVPQQLMCHHSSSGWLCSTQRDLCWFVSSNHLLLSKSPNFPTCALAQFLIASDLLPVYFTCYPNRTKQISQIEKRVIFSLFLCALMSVFKRVKTIHSLFSTYSYVNCLGRWHGTVFAVETLEFTWGFGPPRQLPAWSFWGH
jgi:hypothetical protein